MNMDRRTFIGGASAIAATALSLQRARAEGQTVNVYNWADYIGQTTVADFEKATGIKVVYDTYDSSETVEAKMLTGSTGYDVVCIASRTLPRFVAANIVKPLDKAKLPNLAHLDPTLETILGTLDPGNAHAIPYMWGSTGVTTNVDLVKAKLPDAPFESLDLLFKPENAEKLASCGINMLDSQANVIPMVLAYLGRDPLSEKQEDLDAVVAAFKPVRQYFKSFDNSNYINGLPNKDVCVTMSWSGDYATASARGKEAGVNVNLRYDVPNSGSPIWFDVFVIPSDSKNVDAAHAFLNYLLDPQVIAAATNFTNYANANKDATQYVSKDIVDNPAIYPSEDVKKRLWLPKPPSDEYERARTRAWNRIRTGS
ncbi:MAG: polyamine ABC transporter substrate-binding protein [Hyphomicrobiales bacterium]